MADTHRPEEVLIDLSDEPTAQGAQHADLFEDVGKKVEGLTLDESDDQQGDVDADEGPKLVEEVESYCVNCGDNV